MYCVGLPCVCLTLLASFFVPSHLSLKTCTCTCTLICWSCGYVSHDLYCVCEPLGQGNHAGCHQSSPCKRPGYSPSKNMLREKAAIEAYEKALQQTQVYRYAESYCRVLPHVCMFARTCTCTVHVPDACILVPIPIHRCMCTLCTCTLCTCIYSKHVLSCFSCCIPDYSCF